MSGRTDLDDLLLSHAAGRLAPPLATLVASHLELSPASRERYRLYLELGGLFLARSEPEPVRADPLALLERAGDVPDPAPAAPAHPFLPRPLVSWLAPVLAALPEEGPPVLQMPLPVPGGARAGACAFLLRLAAGAALPPHGHPCLEVTLVLRGSLSDGGCEHRAGELVVCDETLVHAPRAGAQGCLAVSVLCAPVAEEAVVRAA